MWFFTKTKSLNKVKIFDQAITSEYEVAVMWNFVCSLLTIILFWHRWSKKMHNWIIPYMQLNLHIFVNLQWTF